MYCFKCGEQLSDDAKFCNACGESTALHKDKKSFKDYNFLSSINKKHFIIVVALMTLILLLPLIVKMCSPKFKLKYNWDTYIDEVRNNEYVYEEFVPGDEISWFTDYSDYTLVCEDPNHTVDGIIEFDIKNDRKGTWDYLIFDKVTYEFSAASKKLFHIFYEFDGMSLGELLEVAKEYFGNDYFVDEYDNVWWRKGNTVISLDNDSIDYYYANYYINLLETSKYALSDNSENILEFLKK